MSDFLATLAARAAETVPTVRPRLPGRFEPSRREQTAAPGDAFEVVAEALAPATLPLPAPHLLPSSTPPGLLPQQPYPRGPFPSTEGTRRPAALEPTPVPVSRHAEVEPSVVLPRTSVRTPPPVAEPPIPVAVRSGAPDAARPEPAPRSPQRSPLESEATPPQILPAPLTVPAEQTSGRTSARSQTPPESGTDGATRERKAPAAAAPLVIPQHIPPAREPPESEVAPTVQVTIGRIDVRAVLTPSAPPPRPAPQQPRTTLEDYLRARGGGER
jgi:hypothetical protein